MLIPHPQFGLQRIDHHAGSLRCRRRNIPSGIFNWMVHVYPFEKDQASIWSVDRQHGDAD